MHVKNTFLICLFLIIANFALYGQVRNHEFINYDDSEYITENQYVQKGLTLESIVWAFTTSHASNWHPLTWLSHMLDCHIYGTDAGKHHLTNVFFHIMNSLLLFIIFFIMTKDLWQSGFVAALFAFHPLHVESVAWVAERKDVLSTFFWMLTILSYILYIKEPRIKRYLLVFTVFLLGLMAKPMLVTLPLVLLLLDYWPLGRFQFGEGSKKNTHLILEKIPFLLVCILSSIVTFLVQQSGGTVGSLNKYSLIPKVANAIVSYERYIEKMIWPRNLAVLYPHPGMLPLWRVAGASLLLVVIFSLGISTIKSHPYFAVGWLWYIVTLVPVIGLVQVGIQGMADRYTYIPLIGIFIIIAWGVPNLFSIWRYRNVGFIVIIPVLLSVLMAFTWIQIRYWRNSVTLFKHTLDITSNNFVAHNNLGSALAEKGEIEEAMKEYSKATKIEPNFIHAHMNLGHALRKQGRTHEAIEKYLEILRKYPKHAIVHYYLGEAFKEEGEVNRAIKCYFKAIRLDSGLVDAHVSLAVALREQGKISESINKYLEILRKYPNHALSHFNLGCALMDQGNFKEAIDHYLEALRSTPDYAEAHNNIGIAYMRLGKLKKARYHYQEALRIKPDYANAHGNLGVTCAGTGSFKEAITHFKKALSIKSDYVEVHYNLGMALAHQEKHTEAAFHFQEALRLKPQIASTLKMALNKLKGIHGLPPYNELIKNLQL
ncbi:MAG: tetratricopeptide repeat protein [bacterium]